MNIEPADTGIDLFYGEEGPTPKQIAFRDNPAMFKLFGGAVGGGKTWTGCSEGVRLSLAFEGNSKTVWYEGNYSDYEEDRKNRLGEEAINPHRIKFKKLA